MVTSNLFKFLCVALVLSRTSIVCAASLRGTEVIDAASASAVSSISAESASIESADAASMASAEGANIGSGDALDLANGADSAGLANATFADRETEFDVGGQLGIDPCSDRPLLFIAVPSSPDNAERRQVVRKTWMQYKVITDMNCVEVRFFCGNDDLQDGDLAVLRRESEQYNDMVLLDLKDSYEGLTNKTLTIMQWAAGNSRALWFMKLDDDSWPHLESLSRHLQGLGNTRYAYTGAFLWDHPVLHEGKWAEKADYQAKTYPPYAVGAGYMLSRKLVKRFVRDVYFNDTNRNNLLRNEDSEVGVWIERMEDKHHVTLKDINASMWGCQEGDFISMQLHPGDMECMWKFKSGPYALAQPDDDICCKSWR